MNKNLFAYSVFVFFAIIVVSNSFITNCLAEEAELPEQFGIGRVPGTSEITAWDIDIAPDGTQLPKGQGTVDEGRQTYILQCQSCHGVEGKGGINNQLVSKYNSKNNFAMDSSLPRTIGNYWPYATTLYDYISRTMPHQSPGSLSSGEIYGLIAYLLNLNGIVDENIVLDAEILPTIRMPARELFFWSDEVKELLGITDE